MTGEGRDLLSPRTLARLERLQLSTRRPLIGHFTGEHRSTKDGSSLDFADYREYHPGDDYRRIDYHLLARFDTLLIKLFEGEEDLRLRLLVDTSASMEPGEKLAHAARIAAALGFVALVRRDEVTVQTFPFDRRAPRFLGRGAVGPLFDHLAKLKGDGQTGFADAVTALLSRSNQPGLTVVISDLLTVEWARAVRRLPARGGDVAMVHVTSPGDLEPDLIGDLQLVDRETGERIDVSLSHQLLEEYRGDVARWLDDVAARCRRAGVAYVRTSVDDDLESLLLGAWRTAGVLR